jgi:hypothetical protein
MSFAAVLLAPFVLLFPVVGVTEARAVDEDPSVAMGEPMPGQPAAPAGSQTGSAGNWFFREVAERFRVQAQNQVRVEQHMSIRISPARPQTMPQFLLDMPQREIGPRFVERRMGRCVPVSGIAGVQPDSDNRLILFLRDRRMVSATLERACRARDFYSGFYVDRANDGQICANRDTLLSRSGANCKLTGLRQLVEVDE